MRLPSLDIRTATINPTPFGTSWVEIGGLTQQQVAEKAGISKPYLSQLESGKRKGTTEALSAVARALGVSLEDLLAE